MLKTGSAKNVYIGYFELPCSFPDYRFSVRPRIPVRHELMILGLGQWAGYGAFSGALIVSLSVNARII